MVCILGGGALSNWGARAAAPFARLQGRAWLKPPTFRTTRAPLLFLPQLIEEKEKVTQLLRSKLGTKKLSEFWEPSLHGLLL